MSAAPVARDALAYELPGDTRRGVLLLHGLTGVPAEMRYLARQFSAAGFTVSVPLLAGHGAGRAEVLATGWEDWLASALDAFDALAAKVDRVHVAGICVGGMLGVVLAARRPAAGVIAYSPNFAPDGWSMPRWCAAWPLFKPLLRLPVLRALSMPEKPPYGIKNKRLRARVERELKTGADAGLDCFPLGVFWHHYALAVEVTRVASRATAPALIVHAREDDQSHPRNAERLARLLPNAGPVAWLHDSYHMIHVDQERAAVARLTIDFLDAVDPPRRTGSDRPAPVRKALTHA
jgi:carboxylesterase